MKWATRARIAHILEETHRKLNNPLRGTGKVLLAIDELRPTSVPTKHTFELKDDAPIYRTARRMAPSHNKIARKDIYNMIGASIITPASPAWSFPVVIVTKKNGRPRFCVNYRTIIRYMMSNRWSLQKVEEIFEVLKLSSVIFALRKFRRISFHWALQTPYRPSGPSVRLQKERFPRNIGAIAWIYSLVRVRSAASVGTGKGAAECLSCVVQKGLRNASNVDKVDPGAVFESVCLAKSPAIEPHLAI